MRTSSTHRIAPWLPFAIRVTFGVICLWGFFATAAVESGEAALKVDLAEEIVRRTSVDDVEFTVEDTGAGRSQVVMRRTPSHLYSVAYAQVIAIRRVT